LLKKLPPLAALWLRQGGASCPNPPPKESSGPAHSLHFLFIISMEHKLGKEKIMSQLLLFSSRCIVYKYFLDF